MTLKYYRKGHGESPREEITYDKALSILLGTYRDNDMTRDMLTTANNIVCRYSTVYVEEIWDNDMIMVLMAGLQNMLPMGVEYDEEGNRIKKN